MKKTTLSVFLMVASLMSFARGGNSSENVNNRSGKQVNQTASQINQSMRVAPQANQVNAAFYSEDFAAGIPAGWSNVDATSSGVNWSYTTTGAFNQVDYDGFDSLSTTGTTAANGYIKFDSDSAGASVGGEDGILTTSAINCTGQSTVRFRCNEFFMQYIASTGVISVSNDSTTWTEIHHAEAGLGQGIATDNPLIVDVDITAIAANQATVYIRFEYTGDWDFFWFVDDVSLYVPAQFDGGIADVSLEFNSCLLSATSPVSVTIKNYGTDPLTGFPVYYSVNSGTPVSETFTGTIAPFDSATYTFTQTADFSTPGVYFVDAYTMVTSDGDTANDLLSSATISYHADLMSGYSMGFEASDDFLGYSIEDLDGDGVTFDISPDYVHGGVACLRKPGSAVDDDNWIFTECMDVTGTGVYTLTYYYKNFELANPCSLEVYMGALNTAGSMTDLIIQNAIPGDTTYQQVVAPISLPAGTYFMGFHFYSSQGTGTSSLRIDDISVDWDDAVTENIASSLISVYPNPTNGKVNILNKNANDKNFTVSVINSLGSVVLVENFESLSNETIDLSGQPAGIYSVKLQSASTTVNKSVVLTK